MESRDDGEWRGGERCPPTQLLLEIPAHWSLVSLEMGVKAD